MSTAVPGRGGLEKQMFQKVGGAPRRSGLRHGSPRSPTHQRMPERTEGTYSVTTRKPPGRTVRFAVAGASSPELGHGVTAVDD